MPISNYVPTSAIARPGVCTSTTRPASPYEGQVIYETDTDRTLVWNGSGWVFLSTSSAGDVGLVKVVPTSVTNGTLAADGTVTIGNAVSSVTVSGAFSSLYDNYKIVIQGGSCSTSAYIALQLGATTSNYRFDYIYGNLASTVAALGSTGASRFEYSGYAGISNMANIEVVGPFATAATMVFAPAGRTGNNMGFMNGVQIDSTSFTSFVVSPTSGTITGGTIRIYGYRN